MDNSAKSKRTNAKPNDNTKTEKTEKSTMLDPTAPAIIQVNELRPLPGLEPDEDETQRARSNSRYEQASVMGQVNPNLIQKHGSDEEVAKSPSQMKSVQSSVMRPVDPNDPDEESNDTVFVETRGPRRPAIVREPNNWIKKQPITMSRKLPLGIQPEDVEARQPSKMHSHTGLPSKSNSASVSGVSGTPNSSPAAAASHPGLLPPSTQPHFDSQKVRKTGSNVKQGSRSRQRGSHNARISSPTPRSAPTVIPSKESAISKIARSIFPTSAPPSSSSNRASGNERSPNSSQLHSAPGQQHHHVAAPIAKRSSKSATNVRKVASSSRNK